MLGGLTRTMGRVGRVARESGPKAQNLEGRARGLNRGTTTARGHARGRGSPLSFTRIAAAPRGSGRNTRAPTHRLEWSACRSGAPQHERGQRSTLSKRTLTRWRRS